MPKVETSLKKIVWAIDAFEEYTQIRRNTANILTRIVDRLNSEIYPVYVLNPGEFNLSIEFTPPWIEQYRPSAETALQAAVNNSMVPNIVRPEIIVQNTTSIRSAVNRIVQHAQSLQANLIVASTHGRSGISRMLLGSFAETLLIHSPISVMVVGPNQERTGQLESILFPTDLEKGSRQTFHDVVRLAKKMNANLTIVHSIPNPVEPIFQSGISLIGGAWIPIRTYFSEEADRRRKTVEYWSRWANRQGVKTDFVIHEQTGNISTQILETANQKHSQLITMTAKTGSVVAALIGSITRQVVRHSVCPVWIMHSHFPVDNPIPTRG